MVDGKLVTYIQQQLHNGFTLEVIRSALIQNGYPQQEVDEAISYIQHATKTAPLQQQTEFQSQEKMLVSYIKQYIKQGYTYGQIERFLLQNRYSPTLVKQALADAEKKTFQISIPSQKTLLIVFVMLLIAGALGATAWFFFNTEFKKDEAIDFSVTVDLDTLAPGETLSINNDFINFPDERKYPITLYYTINEKETLTRVDSWQLSFNINDPLKNEKHIIARTIASGAYELDVKMNYGTTSNQATADFTVSIDKQALDAAEEEAAQKEQKTKETEKIEETESEETSKETEQEQLSEVVETATEAYAVGADDYKNYAAAKEIAATDAANASNAWFEQMFDVALSRRICCSRAAASAFAGARGSLENFLRRSAV